MKSYSGNQKPYVYVCYSKADDVNEFLNELDKNNIALCLNEGYDRKQEKQIASSFGVLLFISKQLLKEEHFRKVVDCAIRNGKNILSVYLEDVELDSTLNMQLNSQQALFENKYASREELLNEMKKSVIFTDMKITDQQKKAQKNRALTMIIIPIVAALLVFVGAIYPMIQENKAKAKAEADALAQFGLAGLSQEDLEKITSLHIVGDTVFPDADTINKVACNYSDDGSIDYEVESIDEDGNWYWSSAGNVAPGTIDDVSVLTKLPNLERLTIAGEQIRDISPLFELQKLRELVIDCNPIESLSGIENCKSLKRIELRSTLVSDLSPLYSIRFLDGIWAGNCENITTIDGIENSNIVDLEIYGTNIRNIAHLPKLNDPFKQQSGFGLNITGYEGSYEFLNELTRYNWLEISAPLSAISPYLTNAWAHYFGFYDDNLQSIREMDGIFSNGLGSLKIRSRSLNSLEGFAEIFRLVNTLRLECCEQLSDLSPLTSSRIVSLDLWDCPGLRNLSTISSSKISILQIRRCENIEDLDFVLNSNIKDLTIDEDLLDLLTDEIKEMGIKIKVVNDQGEVIESYSTEE